jgi:hypothetical protein
MIMRFSRVLFGLSASFAISLMLPGISHADLKITSSVTITGGPSAAQPGSPQATQPSGQEQTPEAAKVITTYCKDNFARVEANGDPVMIYDAKKKKVYTISPEDKTYKVVSIKDFLKQANLPTQQNASSRHRPQNLEFDTTLNIVKTDETKTIAGRTAVKYTLTGTMKATPAAFSGGMHGGGGGRRGGFPGGIFFDGSAWGGGNGSSGRHGRTLPSTQIQGEYWLVGNETLPGGNKIPLISLLRQTVSIGPILHELSQQLEKMKMVPLSGNMSLTFTTPNGDAQPPLVTSMEIRTISEEALDDASYKVPNGYKEIKPEKAGQQ